MTNGKLIVITAPSGAGKTTIARHLLKNIPSLAFSVSATTRAKREEEMEGRDYFFISPQQFKEKIEQDEFVEWEEVYTGTFYGTLKSEMDRLWKERKVVLFDVDVRGAINLKKMFPENTLTLFIKPPSYEVLVQRLRKRATETHEKIEQRIAKATEELLLEPNFDVVIVNDELPNALYKSEQAVRNWITDTQ